MAHNKNIKIFEAISKDLEVEDECKKSFNPFDVAFANDNRKPFRGK